ncbi:MAG: hypothetical protein IPP74_10310 [Alphaproteobacteria bacterium]|nr:hypothetical protein [Alphaproteobacteria bacterium]
MKEFIRAELILRLMDIAIDYHGHQSLRMLISDAIDDAINKNEDWYKPVNNEAVEAIRNQFEMKDMIAGIDDEIRLGDYAIPILNEKQINAIRNERFKKAYEIPPVKPDFPDQLKDLPLVEKYDVMNWFKAKFKEEEQIPSKGEMCGIPYQINESLTPWIEFVLKLDGKVLYQSLKKQSERS